MKLQKAFDLDERQLNLLLHFHEAGLHTLYLIKKNRYIFQKPSNIRDIVNSVPDHYNKVVE